MKNKLPKLDPAFKEKWVTALRSGLYDQGQGELCHRLHDGNSEYCCLGVAASLCDVADSDLEGGDFIMLSNKPAGYPDELTWRHPSRLWERLSDYNDNGKSFKWIASYIERYL